MTILLFGRHTMRSNRKPDPKTIYSLHGDNISAFGICDV